MDSRTRIDHAKPHCNSHELYKGILDDRAKGVFNGIIYVHPDAQKTDAKQSNRVLLLSDDAVIDTKPQLEIYADDVKCTHGATVGQIDETALYYLRSRGISDDLARSLLVYAFANEIASELKLEAVREHVERFLLAGQSLTEL
jgi:Fe-S cluster assembly protein SufD